MPDRTQDANAPRSGATPQPRNARGQFARKDEGGQGGGKNSR